MGIFSSVPLFIFLLVLRSLFEAYVFLLKIHIFLILFRLKTINLSSPVAYAIIIYHIYFYVSMHFLVRYYPKGELGNYGN